MGLLMARRRNHQCANSAEWENERVACTNYELPLQQSKKNELLLKEKYPHNNDNNTACQTVPIDNNCHTLSLQYWSNSS